MSSVVSLSEPPSTLGSPVSSVASLSSARTIKRHEVFYFRIVVFQVGDTLFKVPRYGMPGNAAAFEALFSSSAEDNTAPGSDDDNPIRLDEDVTEFDFASLLKATYPPPGRTIDSVQLTTDEWIAVLKLAKKWHLAELEQTAIRNSESRIQNMESVDKIIFAKKHGVARWLREAYGQIGRRRDLISAEEKAKLDMKTYVGLLELRDIIWERATQRNGYWYDDNKHSVAFEDVIDGIFGEEVKET
ncbi:hypothetical protein K488DRAFT_53823 [Vararia minispora EC-137]|uniref:Uncharacterized protein n=1 Tax=Vararia minispora EC-137 TaxID=1314806 RepID=A0ACB8QG93_9AGAM|nr:hypothetical protein K488DRAFT_53823 [Vararia minispora EC-137]